MKNTRIITALVAFAVTFIFSAGLVRIIFGEPQVSTVYFNRPQCSKRSVSGIEAFILQDIRNGGTRMDRIAVLRDANIDRYAADYADAVMIYSRTSSAMDESRFPQDFQDAWHNHMKAWRDYAEYLEDMKSPEARKDLSASAMKKAEVQYNKEINRTWEIVLQTGRTYGSDVN